MDELKRCWKVPYIVYYCNLFEQKLDLIDLRVDEFEEAIIDDCGLERNIIIIHLIQKLLKPFVNRSIDLTNYEQFLLTVLRKYNFEHLFLQEKETNQWNQLSMLSRLDIIYTLCEIRLQLPDIEQKLTEFEANELRIEPLGIDALGNKLWYFGDLRLYEEKPAPKEKQKTKVAPIPTPAKSIKSSSRQMPKKGSKKTPLKKTSKKNSKKTKTNRRRSKRNNEEETDGDDDDDDDNDDNDEYDSENGEDLEQEDEEQVEEEEEEIDVDEESIDIQDEEEIKKNRDSGVSENDDEDDTIADDEQSSCSASETLKKETTANKNINNRQSTKKTTTILKNTDAVANTTRSTRRLRGAQPLPIETPIESPRRRSVRRLAKQEEDEEEEPIVQTPEVVQPVTSIVSRRKKQISNLTNVQSSPTPSLRTTRRSNKLNSAVLSSETEEKKQTIQVKEEELDETLLKQTNLVDEVKEEEKEEVEKNNETIVETQQDETKSLEINTNNLNEINKPKQEEKEQEEEKLKQEQKEDDEEKQALAEETAALLLMQEQKLEAIKKDQIKIEEREEYLNELKYWSCVCLTLDDWTNIFEKYKNSKKKVDQEIGKLIETNYLAEMPALFQKAEKERLQRLLALQPKRQSQRLQSKLHNSSFRDSETDSKDGFKEHAPSMLDYNSEDLDALDEHGAVTSSGENGHAVPLTAEQEKLKKEEIARQREERLKQRLLRREMNGIGTASNSNDDNSQSSTTNTLTAVSSSSDFNIRNYFLMHKVLAKVMQCKYAWPFKNAVSEDDAPDYNTIIQNPIDLSTILLKVNNKTYKTRKEFCEDLELVVKNCITYNGDDTFYGKLALKFQNFFKRWLQIFYPREISTSLEEKNRQLMKLMVNRNNPGYENNENDENNAVGGGGDSNSSAQINMENNGENGDEYRNNSLLFDFANGNGDVLFANNLNTEKTRKKRKPPNPDKDKYIQEPQYVTKRTSSGRLVKMKISTDYDYTSDQELEAKKKRRDMCDDGTMEGIQQKHRKRTDSASSMSSPDCNSSDDEDFLGNKSNTTSNKFNQKTRVNRQQTPGRPRRTVKALTESGLLNNINEHIVNSNKNVKYRVLEHDDDDEDDDDDEIDNDLASSVLRNRRRFEPDTDSESDNDDDDDNNNDDDDDLTKLNLKKINNSTKLFRRLASIDEVKQSKDSVAPDSSKLTFEQYVKKLTGNYTASNQNIEKEEAQKQNSSSLINANYAQLTEGGGVQPARLSLKIAPAPSTAAILNQSNKQPLTVPIINPAITAALHKFNTQQQLKQQKQAQTGGSSVNSTSLTSSNKQITVNKLLNQNALNNNNNSNQNSVTGATQNQAYLIDTNNKNTTVKIITVNTASSTTPMQPSTPIQSVPNNNSNKTFFILNNSGKTTSSAPGTPLNKPSISTTTPNSTQASVSAAITPSNSSSTGASNLIKLINISQFANGLKPATIINGNISSHNNQIKTNVLTNGKPSQQLNTTIINPIMNNRIIMINPSGFKQQSQQQQILTAIPLSTTTGFNASQLTQGMQTTVFANSSNLVNLTNVSSNSSNAVNNNNSTALTQIKVDKQQNDREEVQTEATIENKPNNLVTKTIEEVNG